MDVSRETEMQFAHYADLISKWNSAINLVAPGTLTDLRSRHIDDSAQLFTLANPWPGSWLDLKPLYTQLNTTLEQAGIAGERELRIRRNANGGGGHSGFSDSPSQPAPLGAPRSLRQDADGHRAAE